MRACWRLLQLAFRNWQIRYQERRIEAGTMYVRLSQTNLRKGVS